MILTRNTTTSLRGIAIISILLSHTFLPIELFGQFGVAIFLFASGYGIAKRYGLENIDARQYILKRIRRVAVPYWIVLTFFMLAFTFLKPAYFNMGDPINIPTIILNYAMLLFKPFDLLSIAWFVTYILFWYAAYLLVSKLPAGANSKLALLLIGIPAFIYIITNPLLSFMGSTFQDFEAGAFHYDYLPYAFFFPFGVLTALQKRVSLTIDFQNKDLLPIGEYSYWIYLIHAPLIILFNLRF